MHRFLKRLSRRTPTAIVRSCLLCCTIELHCSVLAKESALVITSHSELSSDININLKQWWKAWTEVMRPCAWNAAFESHFSSLNEDSAAITLHSSRKITKSFVAQLATVFTKSGRRISDGAFWTLLTHTHTKAFVTSQSSDLFCWKSLVLHASSPQHKRKKRHCTPIVASERNLRCITLQQSNSCRVKNEWRSGLDYLRPKLLRQHGYAICYQCILVLILITHFLTK